MSECPWDVAAARHCAQLTQGFYRGRSMPEPIRRHIKLLLSGSVDGTESVAAQAESGHVLIDTAAAAEILGCTPRYVRRIADTLDGVCVAGRWVFTEDAVRRYDQYRRPR